MADDETPERRTAISKGTHAIAEILRSDYLSEYETTEPVASWYPQAVKCTNAFLGASLKIGKPDTIYDEYSLMRILVTWLISEYASPGGEVPSEVVDKIRELFGESEYYIEILLPKPADA
jgi:hypothetical protein